MEHTSFASRVAKLEKNVYESVKGRIRLALLQQDLADFCEGFTAGGLTVLDVGGGSGRFARICADHGHQVTLCDSSPEMLQRAEAEIAGSRLERRISLLPADFLAADCNFTQEFDLVAMHGSVEWMADQEGAIRKGCALVRPGGYLSLLVFNKDRNILKRGINGLLLQPPQNSSRNTLTPSGAMSPGEVRLLLGSLAGDMLLQSGIRVFYKFFRQGVAEEALTPDEWLRQERLYYRQEPFSGLGEHTHFIWQTSGARNAG